MSEKYGVYARLLDSVATTPVSTATNVLFVGAAPIQKVDDWATKNILNTPMRITSMSDFEAKLGGVEDGYNLSDAARAAFEIVGLDAVWMINVHNPDNHEENLDDDAAYLGAAEALTGIYATQKMWMEHGATPDIICCPGRKNAVIANALKAIAQKINGHFDCFAVYDLTQAENQVSNGVAVISNVAHPKQVSAENCTAVWGDVLDFGKNIVSGAAVVACLYAHNDAKQPGNIPVRTIGNTPVNILGLSVNKSKTSIFLSESDATELSSNGVVTFLNQGGGNWTTWGDHTSAMNAGNVTDERARFDSNIRVLYHLTNRFQKKYRFSVDKPMTLQMRNDILNEQMNYLTYMQSIGAIVGEAKCEFRATSNPPDNIALGQFIWSIEATVTPPMKYAELQVAFSHAGYTVYYKG